GYGAQACQWLGLAYADHRGRPVDSAERCSGSQAPCRSARWCWFCSSGSCDLSKHADLRKPAANLASQVSDPEGGGDAIIQHHANLGVTDTETVWPPQHAACSVVFLAVPDVVSGGDPDTESVEARRDASAVVAIRNHVDAVSPLHVPPDMPQRPCSRVHRGGRIVPAHAISPNMPSCLA